MAKVKNIIELIENFAPLELQEDYDNSGFTIGDRNSDIKKVMLALDLSSDVLDEAIRKSVDMLVIHHPIIFLPIKNITTDTLQGRLILGCIENNIAVYSAHTNVDLTEDSISSELMRRLSAENITRITDACGTTAKLSSPCKMNELVHRVAEITQDSNIKSIGDLKSLVTKVAFLNGAVGGDRELIMQVGGSVDVIITAEIKYYIALECKQLGYNMIECGHFESEMLFMDLLYNKLSGCKGIELLKSEKSISPYNNIKE